MLRILFLNTHQRCVFHNSIRCSERARQRETNNLDRSTRQLETVEVGQGILGALHGLIVHEAKASMPPSSWVERHAHRFHRSKSSKHRSGWGAQTRGRWVHCCGEYEDWLNCSVCVASMTQGIPSLNESDFIIHPSFLARRLVRSGLHVSLLSCTAPAPTPTSINAVPRGVIEACFGG